jgi:hypothetical protein
MVAGLWLAVGGVATSCSCAHRSKVAQQKAAPGARPQAGTEEAEGEEEKATAPGGAPTGPGGAAAPGAEAPPRRKPRPKIKIVVRSNPPKSLVFWGRKKLGETPLTFERPRDSGPVDLLVRNEGYFPVHVRAYTFRNDTVSVKMTKVENRQSLFGAKKEPTEAAASASPATSAGEGGEPSLPPPPPALPAPPPVQ